MNNLLINDENILFYLIAVHISVSIIIAMFSSIYLQERFSNSKSRNFFFMFLLNFSLPVIGYMSSIWILYYLKKITYTEDIKEIHFLDLELFEYDFIDVHREFGDSSLQEMILNKEVPTEKKIKALVSLAENISQSNIQIIKNTLSNSDDEVRLYGFAIIDKIERGINDKIYKLLEAFKLSQDQKKKASFARDLAYLYWEMIYYNLSDDSLKDYILKEVTHYIDIAKKTYHNDPKLCILLGRVYMLQKDYSNAASQFTLANELSPEEVAYVMPYLAEINFMTGHYNVVKLIMKEAQGLNLNSTLYPIVEQWRAS